MKKTGPLHYLGSLLVLAVFAVAAWLLYRQWHEQPLDCRESIRDSLLQIPPRCMVVALGLTIINYGILRLLRLPGLPLRQGADLAGAAWPSPR